MCKLHPTTCCIAIWRVAPLTMARRTHDLRRALDVNGNWTHMQNRAIVYARVCVIRMCAYMAPHCGCVWCGRRDADYAAHMQLRLVLLRMSLLWRAVQVGLIARRKGVCTYARVRCRYAVYNSGRRVQDAGARRVSNAEGMRRMVRKHDCALPAQYTKHSNARGHSLAH